MKKRKNKAQQAVAAVVMGMNLVNTMSPLALAAQAPVQPEAMRPAPQAQGRPVRGDRTEQRNVAQWWGCKQSVAGKT